MLRCDNAARARQGGDGAQGRHGDRMVARGRGDGV